MCAMSLPGSAVTPQARIEELEEEVESERAMRAKVGGFHISLVDSLAVDQ